MIQGLEDNDYKKQFLECYKNHELAEEEEGKTQEDDEETRGKYFFNEI